MRKPIIAGNWKMNKTVSEARALIGEIIPLVADADCEVVICPPFVDLWVAREMTRGTNIKIGAQNVHWEHKGAFTGEVSADMLLSLGVEYAIIGHSERRSFFGETDKTVNLRAKAALAAGIAPIICVGEPLPVRQLGEASEYVSAQAKRAYEGISEQDALRTVVAYEPLWAIGTGVTPTVEEANETIGVIRNTLREHYGEAVAQAVRIQYGGSMNAENAAQLMDMPEIDGGLIGGASLVAQDFARIVNYSEQEYIENV